MIQRPSTQDHNCPPMVSDFFLCIFYRSKNYSGTLKSTSDKLRQVPIIPAAHALSASNVRTF
jgi:hypothetical protein